MPISTRYTCTYHMAAIYVNTQIYPDTDTYLDKSHYKYLYRSRPFRSSTCPLHPSTSSTSPTSYPSINASRVATGASYHQSYDTSTTHQPTTQRQHHVA